MLTARMVEAEAFAPAVTLNDTDPGLTDKDGPDAEAATFSVTLALADAAPGPDAVITAA